MHIENHQQYLDEVKRANEAKRLYYHGPGQSPLSDGEYDALEGALLLYEKEHPEHVAPDSPTHQVGAPLPDRSEALPHPVPMLSILKATTEEEVYRFTSSFPSGTKFRVDAKADGVSMSLEYKKGKLVRAMTRGDGLRGEDVTAKMRLLPSVPETVPNEWTGIVRGEVVIWRSELSPRFKNPRNGVAGAIASSKVDDALNENARFYAFDVLETT